MSSCCFVRLAYSTGVFMVVVFFFFFYRLTWNGNTQIDLLGNSYFSCFLFFSFQKFKSMLSNLFIPPYNSTGRRQVAIKAGDASSVKLLCFLTFVSWNSSKPPLSRKSLFQNSDYFKFFKNDKFILYNEEIKYFKRIISAHAFKMHKTHCRKMRMYLNTKLKMSMPHVNDSLYIRHRCLLHAPCFANFLLLFNK